MTNNKCGISSMYDRDSCWQHAYIYCSYMQPILFKVLLPHSQIITYLLFPVSIVMLVEWTHQMLCCTEMSLLLLYQ